MAAVFELVCGKEVNFGSWRPMRHLAQIRPGLGKCTGKCALNPQHPP
jgi:hypothetical protein